jgi:hypothetical protein
MKNKEGIGTSTVVAVGFLLGLMLNAIILIPVAIGAGGLFDLLMANHKK